MLYFKMQLKAQRNIYVTYITCSFYLFKPYLPTVIGEALPRLNKMIHFKSFDNGIF